LRVPIRRLKKAVRFAFAEGGSVKLRVLRSGMWVGMSEVGLSVLGIVRSVVLARLQTPDIFGVMALAMVVVRAIETFTRPGVAQALTARQEGFDKACNTAFTMLVVRGFLLAALLAAVAPWIGDFYKSPTLPLMLQVLAGVFILCGFRNINIIARQRELEFRSLTYLTQVSAIVGTIATIAVAWWLRSVWALVAGQLISAILGAVLSYVFVPGRPRFEFDREVARDLLRYGKFITGSSMLLYIATEIDTAVIGKVMGHAELGYYTVAFTIVHITTTQIAKVAAGIMMPAYSKLQSDIPALRNAYLRTLGLVMFGVLPASLGLVLIAEPLIRVVYGEKWLLAAVPLQLLAMFGLFRSLAAFTGYLFEGIGQPKVAFTMAGVRLAVLLPLIVPAALYYGLAGVAILVTAGMAAQWIVGLFYLHKRLDIRFGKILRKLWQPVWTSACMGLAAWGMMLFVDANHVGGLLATMGVAAVVYLIPNLKMLLALKNGRWN
jgi:O-antigen/teichoic acid export membrane protein